MKNFVQRAVSCLLALMLIAAMALFFGMQANPAHHDDIHADYTCNTFTMGVDFFGGGAGGSAREALVTRDGVQVADQAFTGKVDIANFYTDSGPLPANHTYVATLYNPSVASGNVDSVVTLVINKSATCTSTATQTSPPDTATPTPTQTDTAVPDTQTPTETATDTQAPPTETLTPTDTAVPDTATPTDTPIPDTATPTQTGTLSPTETPTETQPAASPTSTLTQVAPTSTNTETGSTATNTNTPPGPTATSTSTLAPSATSTIISPSGTPGPTNTPAHPGDAPSYVDVSYRCTASGIDVFVGMSAHVTVYGLGDAITSEHDTGDSKIKVPLPLGKYVWIAQPPAGHYVVGATTGQIDATDACKVAAPTATVTQESTLLPVTGDGDISVAVAIAIGVGLLGLLAMVVGGSRLLKK